MHLKLHRSIGEFDAPEWNRLQGTHNPFLRYEFLHALEVTGCVGPEAGWLPLPAGLWDADGQLLAAAPVYLKSHSWGEFVFDWAWADAHEQRGIDYYPKLIVAAPFTPATGPRLLVAPGQDRDKLLPIVAAGLRNVSREQGWSSVHWLFLTEAELEALDATTHSARHGFQYHWHNRGYQNFDEFLGALTSKKRKNIRRERREVHEQGFRFRRRFGSEVEPEEWARFDTFYRSTFAMHGNHPFLNAEFFATVGRTMGEQVLLIEALLGDTVEAAALCFVDEQTLYGRYWGATNDYNGLHFETCYYQGIEHCIENQLACFEPGAQGDHKVARGFLPARTYSAHALNDPTLGTAIEQFVAHERSLIAHAIEQYQQRSPYRSSEP